MATHQSNTTPIVSMGDGNTANVAAQAASSKSAESSRQLSDNELSYYLPGRADGVNDMYVPECAPSRAGSSLWEVSTSDQERTTRRTRGRRELGR